MHYLLPSTGASFIWDGLFREQNNLYFDRELIVVKQKKSEKGILSPQRDC